ncbi:hypothetical protein [Actinoplanes sp. G11-F43]|uniref:hypothetical protein n=1 Tax=Actinoplanes sp. G11-F43 TaxID=3424130 RepID=UPI003D3412BE
MTRTPQWLMFSLAATLALTGCGGPAAATGTAGAESVALQAVGYRADETEAGTEAAEPGVRPRLVRKLLRRDALHGEVVVQDRDDQMHTVVVQRGEVTAASADGFTVRSADGFALS